MSREIKILCVGDVVGSQGCDFLRKTLSDYKRKHNIDICIVNGENSAVGNGMLPNSCNHIFTSGADFITGGNHSLKRREIFDYLDNNENVIRPANFGDGVWGKGWGIIDKGAYRVGVINLLGRVWLEGHADPFETAEKIIDILKKETNIILPLTYTMEKFLKAVIIYYGWTTYKDNRKEKKTKNCLNTRHYCLHTCNTCKLLELLSNFSIVIGYNVNIQN